jgi:tetratricopeptide (TPR) repeat protein
LRLVLAASLGFTLILASVLGGVGTARADEEPAAHGRMKALAAAAAAFVQAGDYRRAFDTYEEAYRAEPNPVILLNQAQCLRNLGELESARARYRAFLEAAPQDRNREAAVEYLRQVEAELAARRPNPVVGPVAPRSPPPAEGLRRRLALGLGLSAAGLAVAGLALGLGFGLSRFDCGGATVCHDLR